MIRPNCQRIVSTSRLLKGAIDRGWEGFGDAADTTGEGVIAPVPV
jgi:hypothetical protein